MADKYRSFILSPLSIFLPSFHLSLLNPTLFTIGMYVSFICWPKQKNRSNQDKPPGLSTRYTSYNKNSRIRSGIQLLSTCMECTRSRVESKKGRWWPTVRWIGTRPREAMKELNGPSKFIVVVTMVTLCSRIRAAKVPVPPPMSRLIRTLPGDTSFRT